jgi:hypothetical protein
MKQAKYPDLISSTRLDFFYGCFLQDLCNAGFSRRGLTVG